MLALLFALTAAEPQYDCYWVRGRMQMYNGSPSLRIWPRKTKRLLGVVSAKDEDEPLALRVPPNIREHIGWGKAVWANYHVCPTTAERPGWLRMVTVREARYVHVVHFD
ncbi:hypothetical protein [Sphingomicrobium lutaoense]|nr:hypothetical protein [Sphingomicrobium lutaoense]